jgi:uncharacterized membrane protein YeaQ/YmgE (transglycosylase-associated protein family)
MLASTGTAWTVIGVLVSAFITGALARFAVPGPDPMPAWLTIAIGLGGSLIGGGIAYAAGARQPVAISLAGFAAAVVLVVLYRRFVQHRPLSGPEAHRFPKRGFGVQAYRERLKRAGIDPDKIGTPQQFGPTQPTPAAQPAPAHATSRSDGEDPTENPAHFLGLLEELHDSGVLDDDEYTTARTRLLEKLRG